MTSRYFFKWIYYSTLWLIQGEARKETKLAIEVWLAEFSFLQIRASSQHAECSQCIRHRHMIRHLSHHLRARTQQQTYYWEHLRAQYADRLVYYDLRSKSRSHDGRNICVIQDGLDQSKVAIPRSSWQKGKEYASLNRPKLHVSLTLVHGFSCYGPSATQTLRRTATLL